MSPKNTIIIFSMGSRGDIQPYLFLAKALDRSGFHTTVATHPCWQWLVEEYGVEFSPIGPDIDIEMESAKIRGNSAHWILGAIRTAKFVFKIIENSSGEIYKLCRNADLVIASHSHIGAIEAQACGVPIVSVTLHAEVIPQPLKPRTKSQKISEALLNAAVNPLMMRPYNKIRKKYHMKPLRSVDEIMSPYLNLIPVSSFVVPQSPYWTAENKVVGYWYDSKKYEPSPELKSFLASGSKPAIVSLGAMSFESGEEKEKLDVFIRSFQKTGMRAIIQGFDRTLKNYILPETVYSAGSIPHDWLFQQGYCVIHHGGFGTAASALLAGKPSIVIPHVLDQFAWADRIYKLNVGVKPIKASELTEQKLVEQINLLKANYEQISANVLELSNKMKSENGLQKAVSLIQNVMENLGNDISD